MIDTSHPTRLPIVEMIVGTKTFPLDESAFHFFDADLSMSSTWPQVIDDTHRLRNLQEDWDGLGAEAPVASVVDGAILWAESLRGRGSIAATRVIAGMNGTIFFEWHTRRGYGELEVTSPIEAEYRWVRNGSEVAEVIALRRRS